MTTEPTPAPAPASGAAVDTPPASAGAAATPEPTPSLVVGSEPPAGSQPGGATGAPDPGTGDGTKDEGQTSGKADDAKSVVPEKYEFKFPDGITVDEVVLGKFDPVARELGLSNDQGQKLADLYLGLEQARQEAWKATTEGWVDVVKKDAEMGGENFTATVAAAQAANKRFGSPELTQFFNTSGFGNHPELVRFLAKIGKAMGPDAIERGNTAPEPKSAEEVLFPTMFQK